jgi:hypothetical protein
MTQSPTELLAYWIELDSLIDAAKKQKREVIYRADSDIAKLEVEREEVIAMFDAEMKANGVLADDILMGLHNYRVSYHTQPERVVVDADAVPDEYCKIERKPKLTEIKAMLQEGVQTNWARLERSEPKLNWKMVKK